MTRMVMMSAADELPGEADDLPSLATISKRFGD